MLHFQGALKHSTNLRGVKPPGPYFGVALPGCAYHHKTVGMVTQTPNQQQDLGSADTSEGSGTLIVLHGICGPLFLNPQLAKVFGVPE